MTPHMVPRALRSSLVALALTTTHSAHEHLALGTHMRQGSREVARGYRTGALLGLASTVNHRAGSLFLEAGKPITNEQAKAGPTLPTGMALPGL